MGIRYGKVPTWDPTSTLRAFFTFSIGIFSEDHFAQMEHLPLSFKKTRG